MVKLVCKNMERNRIFMVSKHLPYKIQINYKKENSYFTVEKPNSH